ncbi:Kinesin-like protein [Pleurotus pulmonarius]
MAPVPFTPKRLSSSLPAPTPSTTRRFKAAISSESKLRSTKTPLSIVPGTPMKLSPSNSSSSIQSRPRTPNTPRSKSRGPTDDDALISEMDVTRVDPEEVLVDYQTIENDLADMSAEIDEAWIRESLLSESSHGKEDKVMVSVRVRNGEGSSAWVVEQSSNTLKVDPSCSKHAANPSTSGSFTFDAVHTGTPNKPIYHISARSHVYAAMDGYNAVVFAYGQTASGKTFTLSGTNEEPGIIPRAMRDVFGYIKKTPEREYLLRCSYLEIYNETIVDLLAPPSTTGSNVVQIQGTGPTLHLSPLREEVVTSLKAVKEVLKRGEGNRRTACTDWNERSSRSHSVFRVVIESRERDQDAGRQTPGRQTPGLGGRQTPGPNGRQTPGPKLQARGGRSVQSSVLSLIDLAGSEKATSDKERTREGKYINTSLLTLGTVIGTLSENAVKGKADHVPFRNSKLTRLLQPSLSGNARISVICTINPDTNAVAESTSTLLFAKRVKGVQLHAQKKEIVDTDALIERYQKEIEELKRRLAEREAEAPVRNRRLSAREQIDESKAMRDLNSRIQQLTKLILTSQNVEENAGDASRPASPVKIDFDMSPYQLQQELLNARLQLESQASQILSLEAALLDRSPLSPSATESEKDKLITEQAKTIRELEIVVKGYEDNLGEPLRQVKEDVEKEWSDKVRQEKKKKEESERWAEELVKQLEKEKKTRTKLEEERRALAAFVSKFDSLGLGGFATSIPTPSRSTPALSERKVNRPPIFPPSRALPVMQEEDEMALVEAQLAETEVVDASPLRVDYRGQPSLLEQAMPGEEDWNILNEVSFETEVDVGGGTDVGSIAIPPSKGAKGDQGKVRSQNAGKENLPC